jgi:hypothetical protein
MNMLSVEPFCKFTICSCAWKKLCLTTSKIVFDNKQIILSKNCVWWQTKLYLTTRKLCCQKIVFDDKQNCIWQQANCVAKNCVWQPKKIHLTTSKLYCQKIVFEDKQNCIWQQTNCIVVSTPSLIPKGVWNLKHTTNELWGLSVSAWPPHFVIRLDCKRNLYFETKTSLIKRSQWK